MSSRVFGTLQPRISCILLQELFSQDLQWESNKEDILLSKTIAQKFSLYDETLNNEYIKRIHQKSYYSLSDNGMLQIFSFLIKWLYGTL